MQKCETIIACSEAITLLSIIIFFSLVYLLSIMYTAIIINCTYIWALHLNLGFFFLVGKTGINNHFYLIIYLTNILCYCILDQPINRVLKIIWEKRDLRRVDCKLIKTWDSYSIKSDFNLFTIYIVHLLYSLISLTSFA